jgi:uncharacterized delta-60 repeat protein/uncharacterized repeat protein (TIGR01451 family)
MKNQTLSCLRKATILLLLLILSQYRLQAQNDGTPDPAFNIGSGANSNVTSIVLQADGKLLLGGDFITFNGISKNYIVRLNANGSIDNTFNIGLGASNSVNTIVLQTDGKILVGGTFTNFNGLSKNSIVRLNNDGSIDNTFICSGALTANSQICSMALQKDGKILAGGYFYNFNGVSKNGLVRLNADGSIDNSFNIGTGGNNSLLSVNIQNDGKILVGGYFTIFNGVSKNYMVRLNTDGSLDNTFNIGSGANNPVISQVLQVDGKILVGGNFTAFNGLSRNCIVRLNMDGSIDKTFNIGSGAQGSNNYGPLVRSFALQSDGRILVGGQFTSFNGISNNCVLRLNSDGSIDNTFNIGSGANLLVYSILILPDGKIFIGGQFTTFNSVSYNSLVCLKGYPIYYNTIHGSIYTDGNNDCNLQFSEKYLPFVFVKAMPGNYYGSSDNFGQYKLKVDSGSVIYAVSQEFNSRNSKLLVNQCASSQSVSLSGQAKDTCCFNFADTLNLSCYVLDIEIQKTRARQCIKSTTYVNYTNYGNLSATGAKILIEYPSYIFPLTSTPMWSSIQGSSITYNIGTIQGQQSGQIIITDSVDCLGELGHLTECIKATISPASNCIADNSAWDKSSMKVTGNCISGSAHFTITNDGTGDMGSSLQYRVYVNDTLVYTGNYKLNSGQSFTVDYPAAGQTIRVEADQHPLHPGKSHPRATIENCGTAISGIATTELITTTSLDDLDEEVAITCAMITNSHDPNEKQALPSGIGAAHNVVPGEEIEYVIHFQNTGNDTAYTVTVVDTLDAGLDVASFTQSASSHPYTLSISGKGQAVLTFRFDQINLPDSTTNNLASSGLASYRMTVRSDTAIGTVIKNKAQIFFDYNAPIVTNETMHTIDTVTYKNLSKGSAVQVGAVTTGLTAKKVIQTAKIYPNPTIGIITVEMPEAGSNSELRIMSLVGVQQKSVPLSSAIQQVSLEGLGQGMYLYEVWQNGERKAGGKLLVN